MALGRAVFVTAMAAVRSNALLGAGVQQYTRAAPFLSLFFLSR